MPKTKAILILQDGTVFRGSAIGAIGTTTGEIAFNTGMTGYQEIFTDPSYFRQILTMTPAHIGNYGVTADEIESKSVKISGLVCKKFSDVFSRPKANMSLNDYLIEFGTVGISDVDTRALVRHVRNKGAMNAIISSENKSVEELVAMLSKEPTMEGLALSEFVSTKEHYKIYNHADGPRVAVIDYGIKQNILRCLSDQGFNLDIYPHNTTAEYILSTNPDGIMLSNGPGDPAAMPEEILQIEKLLATQLPIFGICLGHQLLGLALGLKTKKMFNGHRGVNHPVLNLKTSKGEITSQNHGFVIDEQSLKNNQNVKLTHVHLNDKSVAGIELAERSVFSVQYHPESSAGPNDSRYLFEHFKNNIINHKN